MYINVRKSEQRGFTLIELVIVIALLGILAATALPKFASFTTDARKAAIDGVSGALGAAAAIAHARWLANGETNPVTLEDVDVYMSAEGYPETTVLASISGTATAAKCKEIWDAVLNNPPVGNVAASCTAPACKFEIGGSGANCTFIDEAGAGSNTITYNITTGTVTVS